MKNDPKYYFCIPEKVMNVLPDLVELGKSEITYFNESYVKELITIIAMNQRKNEGESPLKAKYLKQLIPNYQSYLRFLIALEIIKRTGKYVPHQISYCYSFTPEYKSRYKYFPVNDMYLIRRIRKNNLKRHVSHLYPSQNRFIRQMTIEPESKNFIQNFETEKYNAALSSILKIQQGDLFYSVDTTSGRYHSNLTNLPSSLRPFIRINGKQLSNIDVKNSQPYFMIPLLYDPSKVAHLAKSENFRMLLKTLQPVKALDVTLWSFLVISGKLYQFFYDLFRQNNLMKQFPEYTDKAKKAVKDKMFVLLFGSSHLWSREHEIFYNAFPNVYERVCILKGNTRGSKFENFKRFSILLQTIESNTILNIILPRINKEHPEIITVTVHDSIMTSVMTNEVEVVYSIMMEELMKFVGKKPTLKIENFALFTQYNSNSKGKGRKEGERKNNTITVLVTL